MDPDFWYQPVAATGIVGSSTVRYNVKDFGAVGDGTADDRVAIQRTIDAVHTTGGGEVYFPAGTYRVTANSTTGYCLLLKSNVRIEGASRDTVTLIQAAAIANSTRMFYTTGASNWAVRNVTLDGNKDNNTTNEHRHGMFIGTATNGLVEHVTSQNFTGDGLYVFTGSSYITFRDCYCTGNERNGITLGGGCGNILVEGCTLYNNAVGQFDTEPPVSNIVSNVVVRGNVIDRGASNEYVVTFGGVANDDASRAQGFRLLGNIIEGPIACGWCDDVVIASNRITNGTTKSSIELFRTCNNALVEANSIVMSDTVTDALAGVFIYGTGDTDMPDGIEVRNNQIQVAGSTHHGVNVASARGIEIHHNELIGPAVLSTYGAGVNIRHSAFLVRMDLVEVHHNDIRNFGKYGVAINGNVVGPDTAYIERAEVNNNAIYNSVGVTTMTVGVELDLFYSPLLAGECIDNDFGAGITTQILWPSVPVVTDFTPAGLPVYTMTGATPEGVITAPVGSVCLKLTAGVVTATYKKLSGTGSTGWVLVG
jgi:hypothetical protein